ncbi:MAG TPA: hypothetical protein VKF79_01615 [Candidatus Acidoferrum sp.]|nr:hypothetical protein [Candidatus Acidoferrum sp.]
MTVGQMDDSRKSVAGDIAGDAGRHLARCAAANCGAPGAATLRQQRWCVDHFVAQCYEALEGCEQLRDHIHTRREAGCDEARAVLDQCALQALTISLSAENLNNVQRSRLLDVLLWSGELSEALRGAGNKFSQQAGNRASDAASAAS